MAKAKRMLEESLALIDVVVELADARAPRATRNPDFDGLFAGKKRVVLLNKSDLASPALTKAWIEHYKKDGIIAMDFVATSGQKRKAAIEAIERAAAEKVAKMREKGVTKTVRAMVAGIPNVGKSTFINRIAGESRAKVGDKPGVTKGKQWVKIGPYLELMDTPGLLWPKLEDPACARHLAYIGSINDNIMDVEQLAGDLLFELSALCPGDLAARYKAVRAGMAPYEPLEAVCVSRGFRLSGNEPDTERAARVVLDEFRGGKVAKITLEAPEDR
jgi:ribosome biogenesis GTPase A